MAETPISGDRQAVIKRIKEWVLLQRDDIKYRFGHLQVPPGIMDQATTDESVAIAIWREVTDARPDVFVIQLTRDYKANEIDTNRTPARHQIASSLRDRGGFDMGNWSYDQFFNKLVREGFPHAGSLPHEVDLRRPYEVLFIVDIDSDFSADFLHLLVAILPWARAKSAIVPGALIRILTMSSDPLHPLVQTLFRLEEACPTSQFEMLPAGDQHETVEVALEADMITAMVRKAASLSPNSPNSTHTAVSFQAWRPTSLEGWTSETINFNTPELNTSACNEGQRRLVWHNEGVYVPERHVRSDYVHILTSKSRLRRIFDHKTNHIVAVNVKVSESEQRDQLSWANRADTCGSKVIIYKETGAVAPTLPRRMNALGHQLPGFLVGLSQLASWPIKADEVMAAIASVDEAAFYETKRWLIEQNLVGFDGPTPLPILALPWAAHEKYFSILPLVKYDAQLARFLSESSRSQRVTYVKVQVAALLTLGVDKLVHINTAKTTAKEVSEYSSYGLTGPLSGLGTMWLFLNLVKKAIAIRGFVKPPGPMLTALGGAVTVNDRGACQFMWVVASLRAVLRNLSTPVWTTDLIVDTETDVLTEEEFKEILWDFLRAFIHQTCSTSGPEHGGPSRILDVVSQQEIDQHELAFWAIRWDQIMLKDGQTKRSAGVYTRLTRVPGHSRVTLQDWTWIPMCLLLQWKREMKSLDKLKGPPPLGSNADEL